MPLGVDGVIKKVGVSKVGMMDGCVADGGVNMGLMVHGWLAWLCWWSFPCFHFLLLGSGRWWSRVVRLVRTSLYPWKVWEENLSPAAVYDNVYTLQDVNLKITIVGGAP